MKAFLILTPATQSVVVPYVSQRRLVISESLMSISYILTVIISAIAHKASVGRASRMLRTFVSRDEHTLA